jgi:hypothetical protein
MRDADFALRFAGLVERRLSALLQREVSSLDVEKYLQTQGFGPAESEALAWGRLTEIGPEDCRRLSELLDLDQSLLALCLLPTSLEVFRRSLLAAQSLFCRSYCPVCDALAERTYLLHPEAAWEEEEGRPLATEDAEDLDEIDRLRDLALDYLLHLSSNAEAQGRFYAAERPDAALVRPGPSQSVRLRARRAQQRARAGVADGSPVGVKAPRGLLDSPGATSARRGS